MAVSSKDMDALRQSPTFIGRVRSLIVQGSIAVGNEGDGVNYHRERSAYCAQIMNNPDAYAPLFATAVATDNTVINQATANGTVVITTSNNEAQQALVTDAAINAAIAVDFNAFFLRPRA